MSIFQTLFKGSRTRLKLMIVILIVILVMIFGIYRYFQSSKVTGGATRLTETPDVTSVPGAQKLSPSYLQLLRESNQQAAQQALQQGTSAIPTVINTGQIPAPGSQTSTTSSCQTFCNQWSECGGCQSVGANSKSLLGQMVSAGDLSPVVAAQLTKLTDGCTTIDDYALALNKLVGEGELKSSQAQQLLAAYRNKLDKLSPQQLVSQLLGANELNADTASQINQLNTSGASPNDYYSTLNQMVQDGKLDAKFPKCLSATYAKTYKPLSSEALVDQMLAAGQISPEIAKQIKQLNAAGLSCDDYTKALDKLSQDQKITPSQETQLTTAYCGKSETALSPSYDNLVQGLVTGGKLTPDAALQLQKLSEARVPASDYAAELNRLVQAGEITPPSTAQQLLQAYRAQYGDVSIPDTDTPAMAQIKENQQKAALDAQEQQLEQQIAAYQEKLKQQQAQQAATTTAETNGDAQAAQQAQQAQMSAQQQAIENQAKSLFSSWDVVPQTYVALPQTPAESQAGETTTQAEQKGAQSTAKTQSIPAPMIKAGTIMFAVLDTALNSDEPGPVMATMVSGKFKDAKLMGSLKITPNGERVMLTFTSMVRDDWPENIAINAVAINPDTARTAVASDVNHHYLLRFGSVFAANFLAGYGQAISQEGSTITTTSGTTSTAKPNLSGADKALMALGQVGTAMSQMAGKWMNTPPTVKVDAGVGLGILFLTDINTPPFMGQSMSDTNK